ncbi:hypothetical protein P261_02551 [Lachnospiraceae bacterium TWA4]|nr:hypothetical protein P261_02551 [Lachnospiraceae bacterium TWA4]
MDIGTKLKNARQNTKLTQEQVSEALGVSRQTISNWETEKTYPDIISVIKMSDLYHVSLDKLLKEEKPMTNYLDYLEESTNVVRSHTNLGKLILLIAYMSIWAIAMIVFWFFTSGSDAMGYSLMFLWVILPVTTFISSVLIGRNNYWGKGKWLFVLFFGVMYMLAEYATFSMANMVAFNKFNVPEFSMILSGGAISFVGMGIGALVRRVKPKNRNK